MSDTDEDDYKNYQSPEQLDHQLVTLSLLADSRWKNLINLDIIRVNMLLLHQKLFFNYIYLYFIKT